MNIPQKRFRSATVTSANLPWANELTPFQAATKPCAVCPVSTFSFGIVKGGPAENKATPGEYFVFSTNLKILDGGLLCREVEPPNAAGSTPPQPVATRRRCNRVREAAESD